MRKLAALLLFAPIQALAEVLDKELSLNSVFLLAFAAGGLTLFLAMRGPKWLYVTLPALSLMFGSHLLELNDPYVGKAIRSEGFGIYVFASWLGPILCILALCAAIFIKRSSKKNEKSTHGSIT